MYQMKSMGLVPNIGFLCTVSDLITAPERGPAEIIMQHKPMQIAALPVAGLTALPTLPQTCSSAARTRQCLILYSGPPLLMNRVKRSLAFFLKRWRCQWSWNKSSLQAMPYNGISPTQMPRCPDAQMPLATFADGPFQGQDHDCGYDY